MKNDIWLLILSSVEMNNLNIYSLYAADHDLLFDVKKLIYIYIYIYIYADGWMEGRTDGRTDI